jgi:hypothetical protein
MADLTIHDTQPRVQYAVGGTPQSVFAVPFEYITGSDVLVYLASSSTPLNYGTDYTVTGTAAGVGYSSGSVTLTAAVASQNVTLVRSSAIARSTNFPVAGPFDISQLNLELDRLVMIAQELRDKNARSLTLSVTTATGVSASMPAPVASTLIGWDSLASSLINYNLPSGYPVSAAMTPVITAATLAAARTAMGVGYATQAQLDAGTAGVVATPDVLAGRLANGQCRLSASSNNLVLSPYNGNRLVINGKVCTIPDAGVTLAAGPAGLAKGIATTQRSITSNVATLTTGSAHNIVAGQKMLAADLGGSSAYRGLVTVTAVPDTTHVSYAAVAANEALTADTSGFLYPVNYVYAADANGDGVVDTLECSGTGYAIQAGTGVPIKSGDATRTLVGMAVTGAAAQFLQNATFIGVASYWNRQPRGVKNAFTTPRSTTSTTAIEINSEIRCYFLAWADELSEFHYTGAVNAPAATIADTAIGIDSGVSYDGTYSTAYDGGATTYVPIPYQIRANLAEGFHYATLSGLTGAGTASWYNPADVSLRGGYLVGALRA